MPFIRTLSLCVLSIIISHSQSFAGDASVRPVSPLPDNFMTTVKKADAGFSLHETKSISAVKICSCQILSMESSNYQHRNVAVFAEKTNHGDYSADAKIAKNAIEKEKKNLKHLFYDKVKVVNHISRTTDCKSLYIQLKGADRSLVMYDILDADIRK
ncbi:MAG: hypothetical protein JST75_16355 [Bacteroidetes bacterium]|nr:hypothetical protein [Bacteroidota bacterium]